MEVILMRNFIMLGERFHYLLGVEPKLLTFLDNMDTFCELGYPASTIVWMYLIDHSLQVCDSTVDLIELFNSYGAAKK